MSGYPMTPYDQRNQITLAREMLELRKAETTFVPDEAMAAPGRVYWSDIKRLLEKHKRLTTGDIASMTGKTELQVKSCMDYSRKKGRVKVDHVKHRIVIWGLV